MAALTAAAGVALVLALTGTTSAPTAVALSAVLTSFVLVVVKAAQSGDGHTRRLLHALAVLAGPIRPVRAAQLARRTACRRGRSATGAAAAVILLR